MIATQQHSLSQSHFTDRERAAWNWLHGKHIGGWRLCRQTKVVTDWKGGSWDSLIQFAQRYGWEG